MTLTKEHIIDSLYNGTDLTKAQSAELISSLIKIMKSTLENGEDILREVLREGEKAAEGPQSSDRPGSYA